MVQCEMCGAETGAPKTIKVEGAELDVCTNCADLGTEVTTSTSGSADTKYSTSSSTGGGTSNTTSSGSASTGSTSRATGSGGSRGDDMFDSLGDLAQDYDDRIRTARESQGLSQQELADELNEKRSLINKLERGEILPDDGVQQKLERYLKIELTGESAETDEWSSEEAEQSFTLGEMAERRE